MTGAAVEGSVDRSQTPRTATPAPADVRAALALVPTEASPPEGSAVDPGAEPLTIVSDEFVVPDDPVRPRAREKRRREIAAAASALDTAGLEELRIGATGQRTLAVHCAEPGQWTLRLRYAHAHDPTVDPAADYELHLDVDPTPTHAYRLRRLAADLDARLPGDPDDDEIFEVTP